MGKLLLLLKFHINPSLIEMAQEEIERRLETDESFYRLVEQLNERLSIFSIPVERRKFKPHLTMLRLKKDPGKEFISKFKEYSFDNWNFQSNEIYLIQSELFPSGAHYSEIKKYYLK